MIRILIYCCNDKLQLMFESPKIVHIVGIVSFTNKVLYFLLSETIKKCKNLLNTASVWS